MGAFKRVLAIDIQGRIDNFLSRMHETGFDQVEVIQHADEIFALDHEKTHEVDAILISIYEPLNVEHVRAFPQLKYIGILGTSTAKIPHDYCKQHAISVGNIKEYCDYETAEWVMGEIIRHFRDLRPQRSVYEKTLGLIGVGAVGRQVLKSALALGMKVFYDATTSHPDLAQLGAKRISKEEIFATCDVVSFHTPPHMQWLKESHLLNAKFGQVLINSCFGKISFSSDLENFLNLRRDMTIRMDHIASLSYDLAGRAIIDSQSAYDTVDAHQRLERLFFENLTNWKN